MTPPLDRHELERLRRSVACLAPRDPGALDREAALEVLGELQRLRERDRRLSELLDQAAGLLADGADGRLF